MKHIRSRKHANHLHLLALVAASVPSAGMAQQAAATLPTVTITETADVPFKADKSANPKITQPLLDTPKTIQVIKKETLAEQGAITLMEALRNTPGITMQLGENGNTSAGDTFQLRGASLQQSTFVDGIRDLGAVTRDTFNLESVEVVKGAAGAETGRGAATGYINLISKQAHLGDESSVSATVGTADKKRASVDLNRQLSETSAVRINATTQDSGVDGRSTVKNKGQGLGLSYVDGLGTPTRIHLFSQHIRQNNIPDGGIPSIGYEGYYQGAGTFGTAPNTYTVSAAQAAAMNAAGKVNRNNYYGSVNDYEKVTADMVTAKVEHDLGQGTTVRNVTRWGQTKMDRELTGINIVTATVANDPSTWTVSRSRQKTDQVNTILANQTSVNSAFNALGLEHSLAAGIELMHEKQEVTGHTAVGTTSAANLYNPNSNDAFGSFVASGAETNGFTTTLGAYVFDTVKFNEQFSINGGVRVDRYKLGTRNISTANAKTTLDDERTLLNWSIGGVYKPAPNGSIYASYADSKTPPGGNNFQLSATANNQSNAALDPQTTKTLEVGSKWELLNKRLNLAVALFQSVNDGQTTVDPVTSAATQYGKTEVKGIEFSAVGQLTNFWQISAGLAKTQTRQIDQRSATTVTDSVRWSPDLTATLWTSYQLDKLTMGIGARHVSEQKRLITEGTDAATTTMPSVPAYTVFDMMVSYKLAKNTNLQFNVYNLFDKEYLSTLNNGGARLVLGAPRSATLTAVYNF
ncbi:catecholate siderophore receptor Fiu [Rhodoferax sp. TS-BS-61-7]|uniref:catecholate siderophore receptor Fiu n=1 Tax=Rhodoferax sp. TS-BS-61-7 TaxID=2094194 RepID=UPI000CF6F9BA|nr:catecholate siderophore receptor Fiu [Rhodoferax sp. TS-BS-61-7]PQA79154.1 catecholate siderophore receptor Fiu [Rhodoferax sp. TS-BS-61-7]